MVLDKLRPYLIDLKNLPQGSRNNFDYEIGDVFFKIVESAEIMHGDVKVSILIKRAATSFEVFFDIEGVVSQSCDRCLEEVKIPVKTQNKLIVTFGTGYSDLGDERIIISEEDGKLNVAWFIYEFTVLALPLKKVHAQGECDEVMASILDEMRVVDIEEGNDDSVMPGNDKDIIDPRWNALKNLIEEN